MGRVKTRPEIWPNPRPFWPTRPDPSHFFMNPSNPKKFFYQPENIFFHKCVQIQSKLTKKMRKNLTRAWPEHNFMNPNQNSLTRDPTRVRSHNPKPDPRAEKRTRPIPIQAIQATKRKPILVIAFFYRTMTWWHTTILHNFTKSSNISSEFKNEKVKKSLIFAIFENSHKELWGFKIIKLGSTVHSHQMETFFTWKLLRNSVSI